MYTFCIGVADIRFPNATWIPHVAACLKRFADGYALRAHEKMIWYHHSQAPKGPETSTDEDEGVHYAIQVVGPAHVFVETVMYVEQIGGHVTACAMAERPDVLEHPPVRHYSDFRTYSGSEHGSLDSFDTCGSSDASPGRFHTEYTGTPVFNSTASVSPVLRAHNGRRAPARPPRRQCRSNAPASLDEAVICKWALLPRLRSADLPMSLGLWASTFQNS